VSFSDSLYAKVFSLFTLKFFTVLKSRVERKSQTLRKDRDVDEEAAPFIYEEISVRFKFFCRSLLSVKKNLFFLFNF